MTEYKGIKYEKIAGTGDRWRVVWPSGVKGITLVAENEEKLKEKIDGLVAFRAPIESP